MSCAAQQLPLPGSPLQVGDRVQLGPRPSGLLGPTGRVIAVDLDCSERLTHRVEAEDASSRSAWCFRHELEPVSTVAAVLRTEDEYWRAQPFSSQRSGALEALCRIEAGLKNGGAL